MLLTACAIAETGVVVDAAGWINVAIDGADAAAVVAEEVVTTGVGTNS